MNIGFLRLLGAFITLSTLSACNQPAISPYQDPVMNQIMRQPPEVARGNQGVVNMSNGKLF
jgi:hypothetical protein